VSLSEIPVRPAVGAAPPRARRFYVETWGCQMNELDSQRMAGQLMLQGILPTHDPAQADVILLNSCSVRDKAEHKVYSRIGQYRRFKNGGREVVIGLCGCVAQQEGERALQRAPELDFVLGPARVGELTDVLLQRRRGERPVVVGFPQERRRQIDAISRDGTHKGMVTIIEGCNKKCTFCIVPQTRGPEHCRRAEDILAEVRHLLDYGFVEIELLGQTVNHWVEPGGDLDFADLLDRVATLPGLERLRFVTSYPRDFTPRMVRRFALHPNICPYLHLPVQSGDDRVLQLMGRGYSVGEYERLVDALRRARPGLALSTDIIVGFPGESDAAFARTLELVRRTRFASIFAFVYSPRPGTAAPRLPDQVPAEVAERRLQQLFAEQERIQHRLNAELVGDTLRVLVTGRGRDETTLSGRTPCHRVVHFAAGGADLRPGQLTDVLIQRALPHSLVGEPARGHRDIGRRPARSSQRPA
jgi:tRNA-2-methylthio-N6-dimethylallyladenosine synthase